MKKLNLKSSDVICSINKLYRIPYGKKTIMFAPQNQSLMAASNNIIYLLDLCSFPVTFTYLLGKFDVSKDEILVAISRLFYSGFLSIKNTFYTSKVQGKTSNNDLAIASSASLLITDRCNYSCNYCYNEKERRIQAIELDIQGWRVILDEIISAGVKDITITGGEPLLRSDLLPLFTDIRKKGVRTQLITNG